MAVTLETTTRRYICQSSDPKPGERSFDPLLSEVFEDVIPPGSSILESDTGRIYRWSGTDWELQPAAADDSALYLQAILALLTQIDTRIALAIGG
jgi:hypothetical protein